MIRTARLVLLLLPVCMAAPWSAAEEGELVPVEPAATEPGEERPAESDLVVRNLSIFLSDHFTQTLNQQNKFKNTLPSFTRLSRRPRAAMDERNRPMPLGCIRIEGSPTKPVDVLLNINNGRPLYAWPPATSSKNHRVLWSHLTADQSTDLLKQTKDEGHWLNTLRDEQALVLQRVRKAERSLLYDLELKNQPNPLKITSASGGYGVEVLSDKTHVSRVVLLKRADNNTVRAAVFEADDKGKAVPVSDEVYPAEADALKMIEDALQAGGMSPGQSAYGAAVAGRFLKDETDKMVAVAVLGKEWLDQRMPMEITPQPAETHRLGLVIIINADPDLVGRIDGLITQLGAPRWDKREAAQRELLKLGPIAQKALQKHRNHKDAEIAFRVEVLLETMQGNPMNKDG